MTPSAILETVLYASDLEQIEAFYDRVLNLKPFAKVQGRHVFYRLESQMLLVFNADATRRPPAETALPVPVHGAKGQGHLCFRASASEIEAWRERLVRHGVAIEADFEWPGGGRSIYFRDPAGNSIEFAEPKIWGLSE